MTFLRAALLLSFSVPFAACMGEADWTLSTGAEPASNGVPETAPMRVEAWQELSTGLPAVAGITSMAHFDGTVYAVATGAGSTDLYSVASGSTSWQKAGPAMRGAERAVAVARVDLAVYLLASDAAKGEGSLYRLELGADAWVRLAAAPSLSMSAIVKKGSELLVACTGAAPGLYASANEGSTWARRGTPQGVGAFLARPVTSLVAAPGSRRLFAGTSTGLFYSDDAGGTWSAAPIHGEVRALHASGAYMLADVAVDGAQRSDNFGATWHPAPGLDAKTRSFFLAGTRAFAGTPNGVKVSEDGGATWRDSSAGLPALSDIRGLYLAGSWLFSATDARVFVAAVH